MTISCVIVKNICLTAPPGYTLYKLTFSENSKFGVGEVSKTLKIFNNVSKGVPKTVDSHLGVYYAETEV